MPEHIEEYLMAVEERERTARRVLDNRTILEPLRVLNPRSPLSVAPTATLREAVTIMREHHIGCVLVVEHDRLKGILTERDLLLKMEGAALDEPVARFMTADPETLELDDPIVWALNRMSVGGYRHVPLVDREGRVHQAHVVIRGRGGHDPPAGARREDARGVHEVLGAVAGAHGDLRAQHELHGLTSATHEDFETDIGAHDGVAHDLTLDAQPAQACRGYGSKCQIDELADAWIVGLDGKLELVATHRTVLGRAVGVMTVIKRYPRDLRLFQHHADDCGNVLPRREPGYDLADGGVADGSAVRVTLQTRQLLCDRLRGLALPGQYDNSDQGRGQHQRETGQTESGVYVRKTIIPSNLIVKERPTVRLLCGGGDAPQPARIFRIVRQNRAAAFGSPSA
jgi:CBS domain-containing protein